MEGYQVEDEELAAKTKASYRGLKYFMCGPSPFLNKSTIAKEIGNLDVELGISEHKELSRNQIRHIVVRMFE